MRACLLRVVVLLLFASVASGSASISAQSGAAPSNSANSAAMAGAQGTRAQADGPSAKYAVPNCVIDNTRPSEPDTALFGRKYADAERLYGAVLAADPTSDVVMAGLVRTTLAEGKLPEALALAMKYDSAHPNDVVLLDALSEVRFRRGEVDEAGMALNRSINRNICNGLTRYDMALFLHLSGLYGRSQLEIERAYWLSPQNQAIARRWHATHVVPQTAEQKLATLQKRLDNPALTDPQKDAIDAAIKGIETREKGSCELVTPIEEAKLPIVPIPDNGSLENMSEAGLEVLLNGKKKRLEIDTGASGLVLSSSAARSIGLVPELQIKVGGIGDSGLANAFVTHVDDIKIGKMEFKNCMVQVLDPSNMVERMADMDGLIGPDVFRDYVVTLDYPGREVRLGPLPKTPGEQVSKVITLTTSDDEETPVSVADSAKDRYIAPEMKDWTPIFRSQHMLILPTLVNKAPVKLFLMDTGSSESLISLEAAHEVGMVSDFNNVKVIGINGEVKKVPIVDNVSMTFAGINQTRRSMNIIDISGMSQNVGVEISGIIGFPILRELVVSIDYRDNLVHVAYDPKKGFHAHNSY